MFGSNPNPNGYHSLTSAKTIRAVVKFGLILKMRALIAKANVKIRKAGDQFIKMKIQENYTEQVNII